MTDRVCECGCGASMAHARPQARYASDACRSRAWKARTGYRVVAARKPRQNATQRKRPGVSVYFPTLEDAEHAALACAGIEVADEAFGRAIERRKAKA